MPFVPKLLEIDIFIFHSSIYISHLIFINRNGECQQKFINVHGDLCHLNKQMKYVPLGNVLVYKSVFALSRYQTNFIMVLSSCQTIEIFFISNHKQGQLAILYLAISCGLQSTTQLQLGTASYLVRTQYLAITCSLISNLVSNEPAGDTDYCKWYILFIECSPLGHFMPLGINNTYLSDMM